MLYNIRTCGHIFGIHLWQAIVLNPGGMCKRSVEYCPEFKEDYLDLVFNPDAFPSVLICPLPPINGKQPMVFVRRIQRAIRAFLRHKWQEKALALMMGCHPRLGGESAVPLFTEDSLRHVLALVSPSPCNSP